MTRTVAQGNEAYSFSGMQWEYKQLGKCVCRGMVLQLPKNKLVKKHYFELSNITKDEL